MRYAFCSTTECIFENIYVGNEHDSVLMWMVNPIRDAIVKLETNWMTLMRYSILDQIVDFCVTFYFVENLIYFICVNVDLLNFIII